MLPQFKIFSTKSDWPADQGQQACQKHTASENGEEAANDTW